MDDWTKSIPCKAPSVRTGSSFFFCAGLNFQWVDVHYSM